MSTFPKTRILVLGGGFGGLYAALYLDKTFVSDPNVEVTLVSRENYALFTPGPLCAKETPRAESRDSNRHSRARLFRQ
jgi:NADH dehydrogenase